MYRIDIGPNSNVQDFVMIHVGDGADTIVGANCSITHRVTLHGCTIGDNCLIGIGATIMDGCVIGENSIVAGGAFLKERTVIPSNSVVMGIPGKVTATRNNAVVNAFNAFLYRRNAEGYARGDYRVWSSPAFRDEVAGEMALQLLDEGWDVPNAKLGIVLGDSTRGGVRQHTQRLGRLLRRQGDQVASLFEVVAGGTWEFYASQKRAAGVRRVAEPQLGFGL
jgi:carbonic anhydrase/acetyltransferase-like protein (isoleucine patch superfamily)